MEKCEGHFGGLRGPGKAVPPSDRRRLPAIALPGGAFAGGDALGPARKASQPLCAQRSQTKHWRSSHNLVARGRIGSRPMTHHAAQDAAAAPHIARANSLAPR